MSQKNRTSVKKDFLQSIEKMGESTAKKIMGFAFSQTPGGRVSFHNILLMFFSPCPIPCGITKAQARLLYIIALHFDGRPYRGSALPKEWQRHDNHKMTRKEFFQGLNTFMTQTIETGGLWPIKNEFAKRLVDQGVRQLDEKGNVQVSKFVGV